MCLVADFKTGTRSDCGSRNSDSGGADTQYSLAQDLLLVFPVQGEHEKFIEILLDIRHARTRPICAEQSLVRDLNEAGEIVEQGRGRDAANVEIDVEMAADEEESGLHPERTATMGEQNFQLGKIASYIVHINGIGVLVASAGKDRRSRVKHHRHTVGLGSAVNDFEFLHTVQGVVGKQKLMRRMDLHHCDSQPQNLLHVGKNVGGMSRMQAATRE